MPEIRLAKHSHMPEQRVGAPARDGHAHDVVHENQRSSTRMHVQSLLEELPRCSAPVRERLRVRLHLAWHSFVRRLCGWLSCGCVYWHTGNRRAHGLACWPKSHERDEGVHDRRRCVGARRQLWMEGVRRGEYSDADSNTGQSNKLVKYLSLSENGGTIAKLQEVCETEHSLLDSSQRKWWPAYDPIPNLSSDEHLSDEYLPLVRKTKLRRCKTGRRGRTGVNTRHKINFEERKVIWFQSFIQGRSELRSYDGYENAFPQSHCGRWELRAKEIKELLSKENTELGKLNEEKIRYITKSFLPIIEKKHQLAVHQF